MCYYRKEDYKGRSNLSLATFIAINVLDMVVGVIVGICKKIHRHFYDKRLLKAFCEQKKDEV